MKHPVFKIMQSAFPKFGCRYVLAIALVLASNAALSRPNILLLVAEDLSARLGAYGDHVALTPNIDRLASEGIRYTRMFTTATVCAPSRAALITGIHQISFGAQHHRTSTSPVGGYSAVPPKGMQAFPELLRRTGYYTFTDDKLDYQFSGTKAGSGPFTIWDDEGSAAHWRNRPQGRPFFGLINFLETHESGVMDPWGMPRNRGHVRSILMRHLRGLVSDSVTDPSDVVVPPYYPDSPEVRQDMARHYDNIHAMDDRVGEIVDELRKDGLLDNTVVIWTTDHGDGLPRSKRELYDTGTNVPMIVRFPDRQRAGEVDARLVSFVDLAPTILSMAGVEPREYHRGINFLLQNRDYAFASKDAISTFKVGFRNYQGGIYWPIETI